VVDLLAVAAIALGWFTFRYERHQRWLSGIDAALGSLEAVHQGMIEGIPPGNNTGWGQLYFRNGYTEKRAMERAAETRAIVMDRGIDEVFVVPTEPLATLATSSPRKGLIAQETIAIANFVLWRLRVFNQLVLQLTDFNTRHFAELRSANPKRLTEIAD